MSTIPQELNWVQKRAECSAAKVFRELQGGIENDVAAANEAKRLAGRFFPDTRLASQLTADGKVFVVAQINIAGPRVVFILGDGMIEARNEVEGIRWTATLTLNDEGRCKLKLDDGRELEQWQFRKLALESLFFGRHS